MPPTRVASRNGSKVSSGGHMESVGAPQVGDRCLTTRRIGLAERPSTAELVRFDPPHHWGARGIDGPIRAMVDVTVEQRSATRAHLTIALVFEAMALAGSSCPCSCAVSRATEIPVNVKTLKDRLGSAA